MTRNDAILDLIDRALAPVDWPSDTEHAEARDDEHAEALARFTIDGERTALWAIGKLRRAQARRDEAAATAAALRAAADAHVAEIDAATETDIRYFTGKLREYHQAEIAGSRRKSTPLPGAKLVSRVGGVTTEVPTPTSEMSDEQRAAVAAERDALVAWLEDHTAEVPGAVEYPEPKIMASKIKAAGTDGKVDKTEPGAYPAVIAETGEIVPGVTYRRGEPTFHVVLDDLAPEE